jgi:hypothetical protein
VSKAGQGPAVGPVPVLVVVAFVAAAAVVVAVVVIDWRTNPACECDDSVLSKD